MEDLLQWLSFGHIHRTISTVCSVFLRHGGGILMYWCKIKGINSKNSWENICNRQKICENHESFPLESFAVYGTY